MGEKKKKGGGGKDQSPGKQTAPKRRGRPPGQKGSTKNQTP
jgi:hypothetical protein